MGPLDHQNHRQNVYLGRPMTSEVDLKAMEARSNIRFGPAHSHLEQLGSGTSQINWIIGFILSLRQALVKS